MENTILHKVETLLAKARQAGLKMPTHVVFKSRSLSSLGEWAAKITPGRSALLVTGSRYAEESGLVARIHTLLMQEGLRFSHVPGIHKEPTVTMINELAGWVRKQKPDLIISAGGGSVLDAGKAVAALAVNEGSVEDYLEGLTPCRPVSKQPLPHIAIPTVSGTGAEMTKNAVIGSIEKEFKKSMRADNMIPALALIDPELTLSVPPPA
ncbi:MAG: iron-containing alcohol dehydrogenase [Lentisphaerota bacterium]